MPPAYPGQSRGFRRDFAINSVCAQYCGAAIGFIAPNERMFRALVRTTSMPIPEMRHWHAACRVLFNLK
jgi:hypothetical protein